MPTGHITSGIRQSEGWASGSVKQIVLHSDWNGVQSAPPEIALRIMHLNSQPFDAGILSVDETEIYVIGTPADCNGCSFTRIDDGPATVAFHTNP